MQVLYLDEKWRDKYKQIKKITPNYRLPRNLRHSSAVIDLDVDGRCACGQLRKEARLVLPER